MDLIKGYLFGIGFFLALATIVFLLFAILASKKKKVDVSLWKKYRKECIDEEQYGEVDFVDELIKTAKDGKTILPSEYILKKDVRLEDDGTFKFLKWIEKRDHHEDD